MRTHSNNFDALRLAAALCVMVSHMFAVMGMAQPVVVAGHNLGNWAVLVFFSISGYLVAQSWESDPHVLRFLMRRWLRIWPALAVVVVLGMGVLIPVISGRGWIGLFSDPTYWKGFGILTLMANPGTIEPFATQAEKVWNGPLWTIPKEFACYVILMGLGLMARKNLARYLPGLVLALAVFYMLGFGTAGSEVSSLRYVTSFVLCFLAGAMLALRSDWLERPMFWWAVALFAAAFIYEGMGTVALMILTPSLAVAVGRMQWPVVSKVGAWGDFSYGTYLYGWPCQQLAVMALGAGAGFAVLLGCSVILAMGCGVISWYLIETPCLRLKPQRKIAA